MRPFLFLALAVAFVSPSGAWQSKANPLDHTKWRLVSTEKAGDLKLDEPAATILFEQGRYSISSCNTQNGKYSLGGTKLIAIAGMSTRKACPPEAQALDEALLKAVTINHSFEVTPTQLTVMDEDGGIFVFDAVPLPSKAAVTKFIYVASETKDCAGAGPMKCLQIREKAGQPWSNYRGNIVGFSPIPGIEYRLRIKEDTAKNPPADGSGKIWFLDIVVEQKVVDKAAAEAFEAQNKK